jgi:hypothetical protein
MLWLIGIASAWIVCCVMAVALCVMARRGDEQLTVIFSAMPEQPEVEVDFVATFAAPEPALAPARTAPVSRASV